LGSFENNGKYVQAGRQAGTREEFLKVFKTIAASTTKNGGYIINRVIAFLENP
jgi:hypothetical protein